MLQLFPGYRVHILPLQSMLDFKIVYLYLTSDDNENIIFRKQFSV